MNRSAILVCSMLSVGTLISTLSLGDNNTSERDEYKQHSFAMADQGFLTPETDVAAVTNAEYNTECGSCHFAYQPGLLPARSWDAVMNGLDNHFGDNAALSADMAQRLRDYLVANAADKVSYGRSAGIAHSIPATTVPLRISETTYFINKHNELSRSVVQDNPTVKTFSACQACHTKATSGSYNEHEVQINGVGNWDD